MNAVFLLTAEPRICRLQRGKRSRKSCYRRQGFGKHNVYYSHEKILRCSHNSFSIGTSKPRVGIPLRRTSGHGCPVLQPGDLREFGPATRWSVCVDPFNQDLPVRPTDARGTMASWSCWRALLLHCLNTTGHCVAGDIYNDDGKLAVAIYGMVTHTSVPLKHLRGRSTPRHRNSCGRA